MELPVPSCDHSRMRNPRTPRPAKKAPKRAVQRPIRKAARRSPAKTTAPLPASRPAVSYAGPEAVGALPFPVVGLGASAGGLEAFEAFFRHVPTDIGMAFVLVSHLDPSHESILSEIVQRTTALPVVEVTDQLTVKPNCIYVIPPNRDLTIFHGTLQLSVPEAPRGQRMPIDAFFRSLAEDQGEQAMGVVLSGTGSDGTLGLRAILGAGGTTFAQDPATAKYDGMPSSAIRSGYAAHVLPVEKMPDAMRAATRSSGIHWVSPSSPAMVRGLRQNPLHAAVAERARLLPVQEEHGHPAHRAPHGAARPAEHRGLRPVPEGAPRGGPGALQGTAHQRDQLLPGPRSLRGPPSRRPPPHLHGKAGRLGLPGLDCRMRVRGGGLLHRHPGPGVPRRGAHGPQGPDLRDRPRRRRHHDRPRRHLPGEHRPGRLARAPSPLLPEGGGRVPGEEGDPGDGGVRRPGRRQGPAVHAARSPRLPEPHDLPGTGAPGSARDRVPLCAPSRWRPLPVPVRESRTPHRPLPASPPSVEALRGRPVCAHRPARSSRRPDLDRGRRDGAGGSPAEESQGVERGRAHGPLPPPVLRARVRGDRSGRQHRLRARRHREVPAPRSREGHAQRDRHGPRRPGDRAPRGLPGKGSPRGGVVQPRGDGEGRREPPAPPSRRPPARAPGGGRRPRPRHLPGAAVVGASSSREGTRQGEAPASGGPEGEGPGGAPWRTRRSSSGPRWRSSRPPPRSSSR